MLLEFYFHHQNHNVSSLSASPHALDEQRYIVNTHWFLGGTLTFLLQYFKLTYFLENKLIK